MADNKNIKNEEQVMEDDFKDVDFREVPGTQEQPEPTVVVSESKGDKAKKIAIRVVKDLALVAAGMGISYGLGKISAKRSVPQITMAAPEAIEMGTI